VLAALALGARGVFVGRPAWWALAGGGADGVAALLRGLRDGLRASLLQSGAASLDDARSSGVAIPPV
jgi:isopentenyl diphosphate isomerase/L-lactate dehydrogenase-like FMN-dependent dehydrogenase